MKSKPDKKDNTFASLCLSTIQAYKKKIIINMS